MGQFRPEKDHGLQVWALAALRKIGRVRGGESPCFDDVRLVILGSCRNDGDRAVLERTRSLAVDLGVSDRVEFVVNCSFDELKAWLGRASVGLHTMWNEHFGIGVVEMMVSHLSSSTSSPSSVHFMLFLHELAWKLPSKMADLTEAWHAQTGVCVRPAWVCFVLRSQLLPVLPFWSCRLRFTGGKEREKSPMEVARVVEIDDSHSKT